MKRTASKANIRVIVAGVVLVLAVLALIWEIRTQNRSGEEGRIAVPAGPMANTTPIPEDIKMLEEIKKHPEYARQPFPGASPPPAPQ